MFRLALELGMTVGEFEKKCSSHELTEWVAYFELEAFGQSRADVRQAITSALIASAHGGDSDPLKYMPKFEGSSNMTPEQDISKQTIQFFEDIRNAGHGR